jgi:hypothetical protein
VVNLPSRTSARIRLSDPHKKRGHLDEIARANVPGLRSDERHLMPLLPFGPDGVRELAPSGTWNIRKIAPENK